MVLAFKAKILLDIKSTQTLSKCQNCNKFKKNTKGNYHILELTKGDSNSYILINQYEKLHCKKCVNFAAKNCKN